MHPFAAEVQDRSGQPLARCYQCRRCTAGCPTVAWYEWPNHAVVRMIQRGRKDELLGSRTIWMCVGCDTCGARCPNGIYLGPVMDALREMAVAEGRPVAEPAVLAFHRAFVGSARRYGRVHEATMLAAYKLGTRDFLTDLGVGLKLFAKGKIPLLPSRVRGREELERIFGEG